MTHAYLGWGSGGDRMIGGRKMGRFFGAARARRSNLLFYGSPRPAFCSEPEQLAGPQSYAALCAARRALEGPEPGWAELTGRLATLARHL
jgi:hypothetical protein